MILLKNATIYDKNFEAIEVNLLIEGEKIAAIGNDIACDNETDLGGLTILPGFVDIHIHGAAGADMSDAREESLQTISKFLVTKGVSSFCPTTMTLPHEDLVSQFICAADFMGKERGAYMHGVNMEGPYIALEQKGAQPADFVRVPDLDEFYKLNSLCPVRLVDLAPEVQGAFEFAQEASKICTVSQAHTNADFETAAAAYENGFSHATHLFSAMPPIYHRAPGPVVAAFDNEKVRAELICDGIHAYPAVLRMAFKLLGEDRCVVVSDAMRASGCGDGDFELGGQKVIVKDGRATLECGNLAGSTTNMHDEFLNILNFGIPFKQALKACTINPATSIGADSYTGSIEVGKFADLKIVDDQLNVLMTFVKGKRVFCSQA